jgi:uncharacterized membrane protein YdbT with pleckstrin-like domain
MTTRPDWLSPDAGETVRWHGGPRLRRVLPTVAAAATWIVLLVAGAAAAVRTLPLPPLAPAGAAVLLALPAVGAVALAYLRTTNVEYVLTDRNVYRRDGVLSTRVLRVGLETIQRTALTKGVWGEAFDYGTIAISTAGSEGVDLRFADLDDPEPVRTELRRLIGKRGGAGADATGGRREPATGDATALDAATADALHTEFAALRAAADRLERTVSDG